MWQHRSSRFVTDRGSSNTARYLSGYIVLIIQILLLIANINTALASEQEELRSALKYALVPQSKTLQAFQLVDEVNKPFGVDQLRGKWTFMYFGYMSCPDVCPMTAEELNLVYNKLQSKPAYKQNTQFVFVSVDPYRDTPDGLLEYTQYFSNKLVGLVAPVEKTNVLTEQLGVFHRRLIVEDKKTKDQEYVVEHDADIYLIGPDVKVIAKFTPPHYGKEINQLYILIRDKYAQNKP